jgi:hypothetical protein
MAFPFLLSPGGIARVLDASGIRARRPASKVRPARRDNGKNGTAGPRLFRGPLAGRSPRLNYDCILHNLAVDRLEVH